MNITPVTFLVQYSMTVTFWNMPLIFFTPNAITTAKMSTGRPVPMP
jgi:hypothetical protein